ncbi:MAG: septum formation initiator family protein [Balneolaceae bacterium]
MNTKLINPLHWKKSFLISLLIGFVVIWFTFLDTYSLYTKYQLESQKEALIEQTSELEEKTEVLDKKISDFENNSDLLEKVAREEYGMRKPHETVYKIKSEEEK